MKRAVILLLFIALAWAGTYTQEEFEAATGGSPLELAQNWQGLAVMALLASVIIVAIAYAIGIGFEMPEMRAWANNELVQIVTNAIIIAALIATITFIDLLVIGMVGGSGINIPCPPGESCLKNVADAYMVDYIDAAKSGAKDVLHNNMDAAGWATRRIGIYCTSAFLPIPCLQASVTTTIAANYILDQDMYAILFEYYGNLLSSLEAQKFFVNEICFKMGPIILAIGIVARSFFFTRKLGGLLIAIAAGLMFFFPGMYIFDWMTLDMTMAGDKIVTIEDTLCPAECKDVPPIAIYEGGGKLNSTADVYDVFAFEDAETAQEIIDGTRRDYTATNGSAEGKLVTSCTYLSNFDACPIECRVLPYPPIASCLNKTAHTQQRCADVPEECKVKRVVDTTNTSTFNETEYDKCPDSCKVVPPLKSDCDAGDCLDSRYECRVAKRTDLDWRTTTADVGKVAECNMAKDCPANLTAEESCVYVIPETGPCEELCVDCPAQCRLEGADLAHLPDECKEDDALKAACMVCPDTCKVDVALIENLDPEPPNCTNCWVERRLLYSTLPTSYFTDGPSGDCSMTSCPAEYRAEIPRNACEACLFTEESYAYDPPINTQCDQVCAPPNNAPAKKPGEYMKVGGEGLVGKSEIQAVSKLLLPAYVLPLFNIVATLVFIKGLSSLLGGDIEIPGLSKVF